MLKYYLEFILNTQEASAQALKDSLAGCAEILEISLLPQADSGRGRDFKIHIQTDEPTMIFDACAQFGRIRSVKIDEKHS